MGKNTSLRCRELILKMKHALGQRLPDNKITKMSQLVRIGNDGNTNHIRIVEKRSLKWMNRINSLLTLYPLSGSKFGTSCHLSIIWDISFTLNLSEDVKENRVNKCFFPRQVISAKEHILNNEKKVGIDFSYHLKWRNVKGIILIWQEEWIRV